MNIIKGWIRDIKEDKFKSVLVLILAIVFAAALFKDYAPQSWKEGISNTFYGDKSEVINNPIANSELNTSLELFYMPTCPHCHHAMDFLASDEFKSKFPDVKLVKYDVTESGAKGIVARRKFEALSQKLGFELGAVPVMIFGENSYLLGFNDGMKAKYIAKTTEMLAEAAAGVPVAGVVNPIKPEISVKIAKNVEVTTGKYENNGTETKLTAAQLDNMSEADQALATKKIKSFLGEVDFSSYSLPIITIVFGFLDGFNPCAFWVLIFMISLLMEMKDIRRIWIMVGTFLFAEALLYFLFMAFWMNTMSLFGNMNILNAFVGCLAIFIGAVSFKEAVSGGDEQCNLDNPEQRAKIREKITHLVTQPLTIITICSMFALAAAIDMIEFACSSALPVVYTKVLVASGVSEFSRYMYLLLYNFFYMVDDFIIFGFMVYAVNQFSGSKYARWSKLVAGILLFILGALMIFYPGALTALS